jgi:acyl carrier protein
MADLPTPPTDDEVIDTVRAAFVTVLIPPVLEEVDLDALSTDTPMLGLPLDSVSLVAVMNEIEDTFGVFIGPEAVLSFTIIGDLADYLRQRLTDNGGRPQR